MRILGVDQARDGGWCVIDYESKSIVAYGTFSFPGKWYTAAQATVGLCDAIKGLMDKYEASAVFIEDIQMRQNADTFKKLAWFQGALIVMFERNEYLYDVVPPSRWQSYCNARGRSESERKAKVQDVSECKRQSKELSITFVKNQFGVETDNDNLADAICIAYFAASTIKIQTVELKEKNNGKEGKEDIHN